MRSIEVLRRILPLVLCIFLALPGAAQALKTKTVTFPMTLDFPLLRSLVVYSVFRDADETAVLLDEGDGCRRIAISHPFYGEEGGRIRFETRVTVRMGTTVNGKCILPLEWEGFVVLFQRPVVQPGTWTLSFLTEDSAVLTMDRKPATVAGLVWDVIKSRVYAFLNGIKIDLGPPVAQVKEVLLPVFQEDSRARAEKMLASLHPGTFETRPGDLRLEVLAEVVEPDECRKEEETWIVPEEKLNKYIDSFEAWDAYLVSIMLSLVRQPLTAEDREILLTTLLEARYRFTDALTTGEQGDFVRDEFVTSWKSLSPVFRRHLSDEPSRNLFRFLAFFTASDALEALDQVGSSLGIEISRQGLVRMLALLTEGRETLLPYDYAVNGGLRRVLGMGKAPAFEGPSFDVEELETGGNGEETPPSGEGDERAGAGSLWAALLARFFVSQAWAEEEGAPKVPADVLSRWIVSREGLDEYMGRVRELLGDSADEALKKGKVPGDLNDFYHDLVLATAWQESCYRQFREKKKKVGYMRSYNGTSVGIMQVNERVWRGLYDAKRLRWDITYNAYAGCEILDLYLRKYILGRRDQIEREIELDNDRIARMVYAVYNGGPSQVKKYAARVKSGAFYDADKLFNEKYEWVKKGEFDKIRKCLIGG
jgi:hypothetical protein